LRSAGRSPGAVPSDRASLLAHLGGLSQDGPGYGRHGRPTLAFLLVERPALDRRPARRRPAPPGSAGGGSLRRAGGGSASAGSGPSWPLSGRLAQAQRSVTRTRITPAPSASGSSALPT